MILNKIQGAPIIFQLIAFSCCAFEKNLYCEDAAKEMDMGYKFSEDRIAEIIWRAEFRRATGKERVIPWSEVSPDDKDRYRYVAERIVTYADFIVVETDWWKKES